MEDGNIDDNQISASSVYNASCQASQARLRLASSNTTVGAWCAAKNTVVGKRVYSIPKKKKKERKKKKKRKEIPQKMTPNRFMDISVLELQVQNVVNSLSLAWTPLKDKFQQGPKDFQFLLAIPSPL